MKHYFFDLIHTSNKISLTAALSGAMLFCVYCIFPPQIQAQIIISEVYPNPTTGQPEWVELFNAGTTTISLTNWKLQDKLSTPSDIFVFTEQSIEPQQFLVAELASAKLNNAADGVILWSNTGVSQDSMDYTASEASKSWQRINRSTATFVISDPTKGGDQPSYSLLLPASTATPFPTPVTTTPPTVIPTTTPHSTVLPQDTPAPTFIPTASPTSTPSPSPTSAPTLLPTPTPSPTPLPSVSPVPSPSPSSSPESALTAQLLTQLLLSEIMACPASGTEWVELYNSSDQNITVSNWKITDESGSSKTLQGQLPSHAWSVLGWTGSLLNNSGDSFTITTAQNQPFIQASYSDCITGSSLVYVTTSSTSGQWVATTPTPYNSNLLPTAEAAATTASASSTLAAPLITSSASKTNFSATTAPSDKLTALIYPPSPSLQHQLPSQLAQLFTLPTSSHLPTPIFPTAETGYSSTFVRNPSDPPKTLIIGGILSGLITISSSSWLIYGKKLITLFTAVT